MLQAQKSSAAVDRHATLLAAVVLMSATSAAPAGIPQPAVTADPQAPTTFLLNAGRTAGWRFSVNEPLLLTHLGLYDAAANGFQGSHTIGLWDSDGTLMVDAVMPTGNSAPYLSGFRYVSLAEGDLLLIPGETYTIGHFIAAVAPNDTMIHFDGAHELSPLINQLGGAVVTSSANPQMTMPDSPFLNFTHWLGPGFQFIVVPAPSGLMAVLAIGLFALRGRRRLSPQSAR